MEDSLDGMGGEEGQVIDDHSNLEFQEFKSKHHNMRNQKQER